MWLLTQVTNHTTGRASSSPHKLPGVRPQTTRRVARFALKRDAPDDLAVFGLTNRGETHAEEEGLGPTRASFVNDVDVVETAFASFCHERLDGEATDTAALTLGIHIDTPEDGLEVLDDRIAVEATPYDTGAKNCSCPGLSERLFTATIVVAESSTNRRSPMQPG